MDTSHLDKYYPANDDVTTGSVFIRLERKTGTFIVTGRGRPMRFSRPELAYREVRRRNPRAHFPELER